jgi:hypothetical protein
MFIPDPDFPSIPDPGVKKAPDPGSGSATIVGTGNCSLFTLVKALLGYFIFGFLH